MRDVLGSQGLAMLRQFVSERAPLLAFDYDGTLCPIVTHHELAVISRPVRERLALLCDRVPCAVLTGRSRADIMPKLEGLRFAQVVGSHGTDWQRPRPGDAAIRERVASWRRRLEAALLELSELDGIEIEDKGLSLSVHTRGLRDLARATPRLGALLSALTGARVIGGKEVFNILPEECGGKGSALVELKRLLGRDSALFVGDDLTDEEVFELPAGENVFKIHVGEETPSRADYLLKQQARIETLIEALLDATSATTAGGAAGAADD